MKTWLRRFSFLAVWASLLAFPAAASTTLKFTVDLSPDLGLAPQSGRVIIVLGREAKPEPRFTVGRTGAEAPVLLACDASGLAPGHPAVLDENVITCPIASLAVLPAGDYYAQAMLDSNRDLRSPGAPGDLYGDVQKVHLDPAPGGAIHLTLSHQIGPEQMPPDTDLVKFIKLQSPLLSRFHGRPIYLRAGVILPRDYDREPDRKYPLWVWIGGSRTRYTAVNSLMGKNSAFRSTWLGQDTPRMILLQLDGMGPYGDPYQVNSANNGPYGDAITQELIPEVERRFRAIGTPRSRVLSGVSTGGWASLALQIFYPDYFNGTWSACPDPVDFRAFELVNIYEDSNAYVNVFGNERPSERTVPGDVVMTLRSEVQVENILGDGDSWTMSGGDWGAWSAVYGPRGADGRPAALWNPRTGVIDHRVAEAWKKYDLRLVLQQNWPVLGPKLQGKLHITAAEADGYFLNNAVHLLDDSLAGLKPPFQGTITYGQRKGHGWSNLSLAAMLQEMAAATGTGKTVNSGGN